jgi:hypothetical protein
MAVTAYQDYLRIYALHPMDELHRQIAEGLPLNPIKEEKTFEVKASLILHMEFLYPSQNDPSQVILILFLIELVHACCHIYCYAVKLTPLGL